MRQVSSGKFPKVRMRRLREHPVMRKLVQETHLSLHQLVMPYFVLKGKGIRQPINAMPGQFRFSTDTLLKELDKLQRNHISSILLFGIPEKKDKTGAGASERGGVVQKTVREIKKRFPDLFVMTDVCLCAYTNHGHCGVLKANGQIDNDKSLKMLAQTAVSHAEAGADLVAPSDMMDGRVKAIRGQLDQHEFTHIPIMSYAAKYASSFYGPFRDAAGSFPGKQKNAPQDRKSYQMNPANIREALREIELDIQEGADIVMVKPALAYLDVLREASQRFHLPLAAYSVSGEYSMVKAAQEKGYLNEKEVVPEMLLSMVRAGARVLITYFAREMASWKSDLISCK